MFNNLWLPKYAVLPQVFEPFHVLLLWPGRLSVICFSGKTLHVLQYTDKPIHSFSMSPGGIDDSFAFYTTTDHCTLL